MIPPANAAMTDFISMILIINKSRLIYRNRGTKARGITGITFARKSLPMELAEILNMEIMRALV